MIMAGLGDRGPTRVYLVRHGQVAGEGVFHGHGDVSLTSEGVFQLESVARRLANEPLAAVYSSDLRRARIGAETIALGRGLPVLVSTALRELHMGSWDGRRFSELWAEKRVLLEQWWADPEGFRLPGGESLGQLRRRVLGFFFEILARHPGETVCLVAHGGVTRVILLDTLGMPLSRFHSLAQDHGCLNLIDYYPDGNSVVRLVNG